MTQSHTTHNDTKRVFLKKGACSHTLFYLINREFGHLKGDEERAADPLAGGIMRLGYQCGMLWGASLAAGAESYRRYENPEQAQGMAILATQRLMDSFLRRAKSHECADITDCDFTNKWSTTKYMLSGKFFSCFKLAERWVPEAIQSVREGLSMVHPDLPHQPLSCASEVVRRMGGTEEEVVMVAGFAGGLGLSGNACGALSAAIWLESLKWHRQHPKKSTYSNPAATQTLETFYAATDYELLCHKICGKHFATLAEHSAFIKEGGCEKLLNALAS